jgi:hypothetical protein
MFTSFGSYPEDNRQDLVEGPPGECGFTLEYGSLFDLSPQLVPLAGNGGPTETLAPEPRSPVIDAGGDCEGSSGERGSGGWATATIPLDVDQRGMPRNGHCDIGAFQTEPPVATTPPQVSGTAETGKALSPTAMTGFAMGCRQAMRRRRTRSSRVTPEARSRVGSPRPEPTARRKRPAPRLKCDQVLPQSRQAPQGNLTSPQPPHRIRNKNRPSPRNTKKPRQQRACSASKKPCPTPS